MTRDQERARAISLSEELATKLWDHPEGDENVREIQMSFNDYYLLISMYGMTHDINWSKPLLYGHPVTFTKRPFET